MRAKAVETLLVAKIAAHVKIDPDAVDTEKPFADYGLDSALAVSLVGELESHLGLQLPATLAWDYPCIANLSKYLAELDPGE